MGDVLQKQAALDTEQEQTGYFYYRERRKSLFDPTFKLFRTFTLAESASIDTSVNMPTRTENLTLRTSIVFETGTSEGLIFEFGSSTAGMAAWITNTQVGFTAGNGVAGSLDSVTGVYTIPGGLSFETGELIKLVFVIHPFLGIIELWLDGERVIQERAVANVLLNFEWGDAGGGSYGNAVNGTVNLNVPVGQRIAPANFVIQEPLSIYADQLPRQFDPEFDFFDPTFAPSPVAWFDADNGTTLNAGNVSGWLDQFGNGHNASQATPSDQPLLVTSPFNAIRFDGVDDFLKTAAFTLNQPETVYVLLKQITWTALDTFFDGDTADRGEVRQRFTGTTPEIEAFSGVISPANSELALNTYGVISAVFNGASSIFGVNNNTPFSGNLGTNNMGGINIGRYGGGGRNANIEVRQLIVYSAAHDLATRTKVINYLLGL